MNEDKKVKVFKYDSVPSDKLNRSWWAEKSGEAHEHIWSKVQLIRQNQTSRRSDFLRYARLYTNTDFDSFINSISPSFLGRKLSFNVVKANVNTACAKISKAKPRPLFLTEAGNYKQQRRAKKLTQYTDGIFSEAKVYKEMKRAFKDAAIFGTGVVKSFEQDGALKAERVFIDELAVDELDGRNMKPREIHQIMMTSRDVLAHYYPKSKKFIMESSSYWELKSTMQSKVDLVGVVESWHLPSGEGAEDGRHVISINNHTLLDEPYKKSRFPFSIIRWEEPLLGFYGEGITQQLVGIQLEICTVLQRIKESQELVAIPRVLVEKGSGVNSSHITDEIGGILYYRGTKPDFQTPQGLTREAYDFLEYLYQHSFQETGISQLSANSKKPSGLDSGVALREYQDIESERFSLIGEAFQDLALDIAAITIQIQKELQEAGKNPSVKVKGKGFIETIKWSEVDMEEDKFVMTAYPTNFLPRTPEGKLEFTSELIQSGYISPEEGLSLLDFPDLEAFFNLRTAALDDINMLIGQMIDDGEYSPPEPYMNLTLAIRMVQSAYLRSKTNKVPEDRQELLRRFIDDCQAILMQGMQQGPEQGAPVPVGGGTQIPVVPGATAVPAAPPVSDLVPLQQPQ